MMGRLDSGQDKLFYSFNLDDHVPQDHLLRGIAQGGFGIYACAMPGVIWQPVDQETRTRV